MLARVFDRAEIVARLAGDSSVGALSVWLRLRRLRAVSPSCTAVAAMRMLSDCPGILGRILTRNLWAELAQNLWLALALPPLSELRELIHR